MRIGIDARLWNETGVGRYVRSLYQYLPEIDKKNEYIWFLGPKEFDTFSLPSENWKKVLATPHWHTITEQIEMPVLFYKEKLDLLHVPYVNFPVFYFGRIVSTIHDLIPDHHKTGKATTLPFWFYPIKKIGYHFLVWMATKRALRILTLSNDSKKEITQHYGCPPEKISTIYESGKLEDTRVDFSGKEFDRMKLLQPFILYVGNAHPHKNVETLIKAAEIMNANRHSGEAGHDRADSRIDSGRASLARMTLVLVGNDSFFYPRLPRSEFVEVIGEVPNDQIGAWFHFASALVTASKMEGFGIPPLEAMSVGCPAIVSDIPVFHEVYGDAAQYFDQTDPQKVADKIKQVLGDKNLISKMIAKGYDQAAKYSWEKLVKKTEEVYENCLGIRSGE